MQGKPTVLASLDRSQLVPASIWVQNMTSFALHVTSGEYYVKSLNAFLAKSGERTKNFELLRDHIPPLIRRLTLHRSQQPSRFNILSVGAGTGEMDMEIMKIIKEELQESEQGRHMKLFNRAIEPSEYSCGLYKAAIENLPSTLHDQHTDFEIYQQTFEEYKESQQCQRGAVNFDMVHFIHSIYYVDIQPALIYCLEKELGDQGIFACIVERKDLAYQVSFMQRNHWYGKGTEGEKYETTEKIIKIANDNGWKHEIYT